MKIMTVILCALCAFVPAYADQGETATQDTQVLDTVETYVGQSAVFHLRSNKTTGYEWQLAGPLDTKVIELAGSHYAPDASGMVGSGGTEVWTFKGIAPGTALVSFKYVRPWEKDNPDVQKAGYRVIVKEQPAMTGTTSEVKLPEPYTARGTIDAVELSDIFKRPHSKLTLTDTEGTKIDFIVTPLVAVYAKDKALLSLDKIPAGSTVLINYRIKDGANEAVVIQVE
ncbi:MAG: protease inhibitor I42 family protein [Candidatus Omnitrophica bacterium]|nr:protease inhibitor I42 family protein [Candidatus Omnitrophota bacterium]